MDCQDYSTVSAERKKGQHLGMAERGAIKALKQQGFGTRAIAREIGCVPSTITNELRRGTPARKSSKGKAPGYAPKLGQAVYEANRAACHRKPKADSCRDFSEWVIRQVREHKWSLDACCGYAKLHHLFEPSQMVCSRALYNMVWNGHLSIHPTELPEALKRKTKKRRVRENKKRYGTSISERPEIASLRLEEGHWEGDTVVGKRAGKESVVFSLLEKKTETYLAFRIPGKTSEAVMNLMNKLHDEYGEHFSQIFKTIKSMAEVLRKELKQQEQQKTNAKAFVAAVKKYTDMQELDAAVLREFIDRIEVSHADKKSKTREITIVYNFIGAFDFARAIEEANNTTQKQQKTA